MSLNSKNKKNAAVAQSVEQRTENPCVGGSNPPHGKVFWIYTSVVKKIK